MCCVRMCVCMRGHDLAVDCFNRVFDYVDYIDCFLSWAQNIPNVWA